MTLTEKGAQLKDEVVRLLFAFINNMRRGDGFPSYIHDEKRAMSDIHFEFVQRQGALMYAKTKANALVFWDDSEGAQDCHVDELLYKPFAKRVWRPVEINRFLEMLTPYNCYVSHVSQDYAAEADLRVEPIYATKFKIEAIPRPTLDSWATALPKENETLDYPPRNPYVPKRVPLPCRVARSESEPVSKPVRISRHDGGLESEVWFK